VLSKVLLTMHQSAGKAYEPVPIVRRLNVIGRQFRFGRQEDSHEFLRCLLDAAHLHELRVSRRMEVL
jgi:ubiquitin carboxyl-terminal hydrolase 36/42